MGNSKTGLTAISVRNTKKIVLAAILKGWVHLQIPGQEASQLKGGTSDRHPASNNILENATRNPSDSSCNLAVSHGPDERQVTFCIRVCHCYNLACYEDIT